MVTVHVTPTGEVESVRLAAGWKQAVDPRALGTSVLAAVNAATAAAMVAQVDRIGEQASPSPPLRSGTLRSGTRRSGTGRR